MPDPELIVCDLVTPEIESVVFQGLAGFNTLAAGPSDALPLAVVARDGAGGAVVGGAIGRSARGILHLDRLWLPADRRGGGLGRRILAAFEAEGRRRGCVAAILDTFSFQAPGFYDRLGWQRLGEIPCLPPGSSRIYYTKRF